MKTLLRSLLIALAFATTGLFTQAAIAAPAPTSQNQKVGKKTEGHKKHKKKKKRKHAV